ncbi:hypothetical protein B0T26DRAFT_739166 [Lasiosphaeria miniovina]|uniref:DUF6594 domain-containing protein n=1 Tax=Lasiosphaeria miniovina TaxID=1954250 RepID=A0AA40ATF0_9PEZI|nr:uncharacterized protein B0T26DRAFT_739166 [Lasiosphaeria miniovina]KAK0721690.1 hypothetical protein B0T26DRAFT_739166 [Lasiosphaeria miniovina]
MKPLRSCLPLWTPSEAVPGDGTQTMKIEEYRLGYPRFTALISAHDPFLCRRFKKLRARLLLSKQGKLSALEQRLERVDRDEPCPLFLGKARSDGSQDRASILAEIEFSLLQLLTWVEDKLIRYYPGFRKSRSHKVSTDPNVIVYSGPWIQLLFLITLLLLMLVVICNLIDTISIRLVVVMACTISYLLILFALTRSRTMNLVLAGAT